MVGFGRIVTDQVLHAMIYIRDIQLFCARGKQAFYEKHGFVVRPIDAPGMQYQREGLP
jgi:hypothetical protein